jgi:anaerobic selenocysteine-containing dehydrogenase
VRVRAATCLMVLVGAIGAPAGALAAGSTKHSATATTPTATAAASPTVPVAPSPSGGGLGGGLTSPGGIPTVSTAAPTVISTATAATSGSGGLSGGGAIAIAIGAFVVLGGICYYIWRDARRRAPVAARPAGETRENRPGSKAQPKARKLSTAERKRRKRGRAKR